MLPRCEAVYWRHVCGRWILRDVNLDITASEILTVQVDNGSGKSTPPNPRGSDKTDFRHGVGPAEVGYVPDHFTAPARPSAITYITLS